MQPSTQFADLVALMRILREQCPWDKKQTSQSLLPYLLEESYELIEAVHQNDPDSIKNELGDILLQVIFHAQIYQEQQQFTIHDVIYALMDKLIRRHPHVFAKEQLATEADVKRRWEEIKALENKNKPNPQNHLKIQSKSALLAAIDIQNQASQVGFDWDTWHGALDKLKEEISELQAILPQNDAPITDTQKTQMQDELGDCFFALVNVCRKLGIDSEMAALGGVYKFKNRFDFVVNELAQTNTTPKQASLAQMDALWELAKHAQHNPKNTP